MCGLCGHVIQTWSFIPNQNFFHSYNIQSNWEIGKGRFWTDPINNKHCEILVSCSDKERNCKLMELHASSLTCMQAYVTPCKLM